MHASIQNWAKPVKQILAHMGYFLLPSVCVLCDADGQISHDLCHDCEQNLPFFDAGNLESNIFLDPNLIQNQKFGFFYEAEMVYLIRELKFHKKIKIAHVLGHLLAKQPPDFLHDIDQILPIPLHHVRLRERGFNQSLEIARIVSQKWHIPLAHRNALQRAKTTKAQSSLSFTARQDNLQTAFIARPNLVRNQRLLLLDDVLTTGATLTAAALVLREAGAKSVSVMTVARASF